MAVLTMVQYHGFVVRLSLEYEFPCWKKIEQACCTIRTETICRPFFPTKATTCPVPKLKYLAQKRNTTLDNKAFLLAVFSISWNTPILPVPAAYVLPARPVSSPVSFPVSLKMLFYIIPLCPWRTMKNYITHTHTHKHTHAHTRTHTRAHAHTCTHMHTHTHTHTHMHTHYIYIYI